MEYVVFVVKFYYSIKYVIYVKSCRFKWQQFFSFPVLSCFRSSLCKTNLILPRHCFDAFQRTVTGYR